MIEKNFWNEMKRFRNNMNRFFTYPDFEESLEYPTKPANYRRAWANFKETDNNFNITVEIPGVSKEDVKVNILTNPKGIEIKAEKQVEKKQDNCCEDDVTYNCTYSKAYAGFYRAINLPENADTDNIDAEYKDGILKITIPKTKEAKKKKIIRVR